MYFTNEYLEELVEVFASKLNLKYDEKDVEIASTSLSVHCLENVLLIKGAGCLLCIDCNARDYICPLVIMCQDNYADKIKAAMLEWDNRIRKGYGQKPREEVINVFYKDNQTLLRRIEEFYNISIHDEFMKE